MWRRKLKLYFCASKIWFSGSVLESMVFVSLPSEMRSAVHIAQIAGHWDETIHQQGFVVQHVPFDHKWPGWGNDQQRPTRSLESRTCFSSNTCQFWCERSGLQNHVMVGTSKNHQKCCIYGQQVEEVDVNKPTIVTIYIGIFYIPSKHCYVFRRRFFYNPQPPKPHCGHSFSWSWPGKTRTKSCSW